MSKAIPLVLIALVAGLGVALAVQRNELNRARADVEQVQARLEKLEARQREAAPKARLDEALEEMHRVEKKAAEASAAATAAASKAPAAPTDDKLPLAVSEEDLQKIVDAKVEEKLQARGAKKREGDGDRKMPLHDLAKEIGLDPAAQEKVAAIANTAKKEILDVLRTPRLDGTNAADDLIAAFTGGDTQGVQKLFAKLFTEKIPGTETTYVAAVSAIQEKANQGLSRTMGTDAFTRYQHMGVKPENIETGFDPWTEYIQQKGK